MEAVGKNVLLIILDSVRAKSLSSHGADRDTFPRTHSFFEEHGGTQYRNAYAPSIWSLPSHVSIFTGLPVGEHHIVENTQQLSADAETVFSELSDAGVQTGVFSSNPFLANDEYGLQDQFDDDMTPAKHAGIETRRDLVQEIRAAPRGERRTSELRDWIESQDGRWAACLNLMDAHTPYIPHENAYGTMLDLLQRRYVHFGGVFDRSEETFKRMTRLYEGCIRTTDKLVANLLNWLSSKRMLESTHVIVTADHGEGLGEPNVADGSPIAFHYDAVNDELLHVPLYQRQPETTSFEVVDRAASVTRVPNVIEGGSFTGSPVTASVLYGGNITLDEPTPWDGERARVVYQDTESGIAKFVDDPRGVWTSTTRTEDEVLRTIDETFEEYDDSSGLAADESVDEDVEERLSDLGYM